MNPKFYIVGGYVRDIVMGKKPKDRDWVVVGATPEWMLANGYKQVGADFPVFLKDGEEYALARTERKTGPGYSGFVTEFSPDVTLEQDLSRRDLTMNAMAMEPNFDADAWEGTIIDPFEGIQDIRCGILRHVSEAFAEDPVRVLRVARFAARYKMEIAEETYALCDRIVAAGEMEHLTRERTTQEWMKVMEEGGDVEHFFAVLGEVNAQGERSARSIIWPELDNWMVTEQTFKNFPNVSTRGKFALCVEHMEEEAVKEFVKKNKFPTAFADYACMIIHMEQFLDRHAVVNGDIVDFLSRHNVYNHPDVMMAVASDFKGYEHIVEVYERTKHINFNSLSDFEKWTLKGAAIREAIVDKRKEIA